MLAIGNSFQAIFFEIPTVEAVGLLLYKCISAGKYMLVNFVSINQESFQVKVYFDRQVQNNKI